MITYEQDPDVVRWGLQLFDGDPYSNCGYCGSISQHYTDCYSGHYLKGYQYDADCSYAENHDLSVNSLHEELSQLSITEPIKSFQEGAEHLQTSFCSQDWFPHSLENYGYVLDGNDDHREEESDLGISALCSSPGDESYSGKEWAYSLELMDEHALDGEVGKILNQMVPIPVSVALSSTMFMYQKQKGDDPTSSLTKRRDFFDFISWMLILDRWNRINFI